MLNPCSFDGSLTNPGSVSSEDTIIRNLSCKVSSKVVGKCDTFAGKGTNIREGNLTRSLEDASFIGVERPIGCRQGVVLGHRPDVSQDEIGLDEWFSIEITVSRPCDSSRYTRALDLDVHVSSCWSVRVSVCLCTCDVDGGFTQPRHVCNFTKNGGNGVDFTVVICLSKDVAKSFSEFAALDVLTNKGVIVNSCESGYTNLSCRCEETPITVLVSVSDTDWNPICILIEIFCTLTRECVTFDENSSVWKTQSVVFGHDGTRNFSTGVVLHDLDISVG